ncbi:hypothetical protein HMPREF1650_12120 [Corynebacterium freneyi DNF00450]|uniref:Uncharacterized protein n=1 Tax=Corynebacterium freneyi DNF00450 TaxID=1287475 RepID=A0A095XZ47_9CORY|nr:hypothetical protein HMPREF1650_12120 [Corynebacterium freneyi DNF00450]
MVTTVMSSVIMAAESATTAVIHLECMSFLSGIVILMGNAMKIAARSGAEFAPGNCWLAFRMVGAFASPGVAPAPSLS